MPRPKGLAKTGGRQKGTPNRDNPLKTLLYEHSSEYFTKNIQPEDIDVSVFILDPRADNAMSLAAAIKQRYVEQHKGEILSQFDVDCINMRASERAKIEVDLLSYHTPKMSAIDADMDVKTRNTFFTDRLNNLAHNKDIPPDEE